MRRALLVGVLFAQPGDGWFSRDKLKHFLVSAFTQSVGYATLQAAGADRTTALAGATAFTLTLGVGKEVADREGGGRFSRRDLVWDVAGAGAATLLLLRTEPSER